MPRRRFRRVSSRKGAWIQGPKARFSGLPRAFFLPPSSGGADPVENFVARVLDRPEVLECFATTGEADYHLRVVCRDKDAYNDFLDQFLFRLPGVAQVRTDLVLKVIKSDGPAPV